MGARVKGMVLVGIDGVEVILEARRLESLRPHQIKVVGLADTAVREGAQRARAAVWPHVRTVACDLPCGILLNLSPADLRKTGRSLDLPLALVYAAAILGHDPAHTEGVVFLGEVGLDGEVRSVRGTLAAVLEARRLGRRAVVLPRANLDDARLVEGPDLVPVTDVGEALAVLRGRAVADDGPRGLDVKGPRRSSGDLADVRGQFDARRALEITAAGGHNLLMEGPPGSGKTMLARRLPTIMPTLDDDQVLDVARIHGSLGGPRRDRLREPPFRAPHHTATTAGLTGGGTPLRPGEFSLAHHGVLFLDEMPELDRRALEALREPLEERHVHLTRAGTSAFFPASFLCIGAMNPCPCGYHGLDDGRCVCTPARRERYAGRLSGPLLDRFDLRVFLRPVPPDALFSDEIAESSETVRRRVAAARALQHRRYTGMETRTNGSVPDAVIRRAARYDAAARGFLVATAARYGLSARATRRLERVARTLADLAGSADVGRVHLMEALGYRLGSR